MNAYTIPLIFLFIIPNAYNVNLLLYHLRVMSTTHSL
nr:MAG TPA: hypothetical protein [Caudoviricetes sp.]